MGLKERLEEMLWVRQDTQRVMDRIRQAELARERRGRVLIDDLKPILQDKLHITEKLRIAEQQARKILGKPPRGYHDLTAFRFSNIDGEELLTACATAGSVSWSGGGIDNPLSGYTTSWSFSVYVRNRELIVGGRGSGANYFGGVRKSLDLWTPDEVDEEIFQNFRKTVLPHVKGA